MKKTFDNFSAVDNGFSSFIGGNITIDSKKESLIASLPQKYIDALQKDNLLLRLNVAQIQNLDNVLTLIANDVTLSGLAKINNAISQIELALPYLKVPVVLQRPTPVVPPIAPLGVISPSTPPTLVQTFLKEMATLGDLTEAMSNDFERLLSKEDKQMILEQFNSVVSDNTLTKEQKRAQVKSILMNALYPQNQVTKSETSESPSPDMVKTGLIVLGVGILGFVFYTMIKK